VDTLTARLRATDVSRTRLVFIGDSITQFWEEHIFRNFYAHRAPLNLGIGGDVTQSLLWRLENGHWPAQLKPEAIVLLIGTNNIGSGAQPQAVAYGITRIVERLQQLAPQARIVLVGILPRGIYANDRMRRPIAEVNRLIAACGDGRRVFYSEPGQLMLDGQGVLYDWIAPDWIHLSLTGYAILSTAIEGHLRLALQR
jgi:lysophospholipase L1-like esterase